MKTFIKIILKILLPILLFIITMSFIIENVAVKTISNDILTRRVSGYMLDEIIGEVDNDTFYEIAEKIEGSPYMEEITGKYLDVLTGKRENIDITEEINQILEEELQHEIPEDIKDNIRNYISEKEEPLGERRNMGFSSTIINNGTGIGVVTNIGMNTEIGTIAKLLDGDNNLETPLKQKLNKIGKVLSILGIIISILKIYLCFIWL